MSKKEVIVGLVASVIGGVLVWLFTAYIATVAKLDAIQATSSHLKNLNDQVVDLRVDSKLLAEEVIKSKNIIELKQQEIEKISKQIIARNRSIEQIDIISTLDGKVGEFNKLASNIVKRNLTSELNELLKVIKSQTEWKNIVGKEIQQFDVLCEYRFHLGAENVMYFDKVHTGTLSLEDTRGHYQLAKWNIKKLSLMIQSGKNSYSEGRIHIGQLQTRCESST